MKEQPPRRGRPPKAAADKMSAALHIKLTEAERAEIDAAADGEPTAWARAVLLRAARRKNA